VYDNAKNYYLIRTGICSCINLADGHGCQVTVTVTDVHTEYVVDDASLEVVSDIPTWRSDAQQRIENIRKSDVTVRCVQQQILLCVKQGSSIIMAV